MGLDNQDRGAVEKIVEQSINLIPRLLPNFRDQGIKKKYQITNPEEFVYGYIHGRIVTQCTAQLVIMHGKEPTNEEVDEVISILERRSREIKEAIFNCG